MPSAARWGEGAPGPVVSSPGPVAPVEARTQDPRDRPRDEQSQDRWRSVERLCRVMAAHSRVAEANADLRAAVRAAREAGDSWASIGAALDASRRSAVQRRTAAPAQADGGG
jgi:hypothetical protein